MNTTQPPLTQVSSSIKLMSDYEIGDMINVCSEMFGTKIRPESVNAFVMILRNKFSNLTNQQIIKACIENASNPNTNTGRFSPAFLSSIIISKKRDEMPTYGEKYYSDEEKQGIKEQWLHDLYATFENYAHKKNETERIYIWGYLASKLSQAGLIDPLQIKKINKGVGSARLNNFYSLREIQKDPFKDLCYVAFKDIAMRGEHINKYIN